MATAVVYVDISITEALINDDLDDVDVIWTTSQRTSTDHSPWFQHQVSAMSRTVLSAKLDP